MHRRNIVVFRTLNIQGVRHTDGVGFMQSLTVPIKKSKVKLNIIQCYVPTNDADDKKKDAFYLLHIVLNKAGKNDMTILMGDFNAKMGDFNVTENQIDHIFINRMSG